MVHTNGARKIVCKGLFGEIAEVSPDELRFRPSIYGLVIKNGNILLCPQWDGWDYPGGGIDLGETLEEALVREVKEETGITVSRSKLLHVSDNFFQPTFAKEQHWHSIKLYYTCEYVSGEISSDGFMAHEKEYMKKAQWVPLEQAKTFKFYNPEDNEALIVLAQML